LPQLLAIAGQRWQVRRRDELERQSIIRDRLHGREHIRSERHEIHSFGGHLETGRIDPARQQDVVDHRREPVRLLGDHDEQTIEHLPSRDDVVALEGHRCAMDGRERGAELVGDGCYEVGFQLLEPVRLRQVAERVDRPVDEIDAFDREPELTPVDVDRYRGRIRARRGRIARDGDRSGERGPSRNCLFDSLPDHGVTRQTRDRLRRRIPEPDDPGIVDEEDSVGDRPDHARSLAALLGFAVQAVEFLRQAEALERVADAPSHRL